MSDQEQFIYLVNNPELETEVIKVRYLPARLKPFMITNTNWDDLHKLMMDIAKRRLERERANFERAQIHLTKVCHMNESECIVPVEGYIS